MSTVAKAVVEAGLVDDVVLAEMHRWGLPVPRGEQLPTVSYSTQAVIEHIREAIESEDNVRMDETDLDLLQLYLDKSNQKQGRLIVKEGKSHQTVDIVFCLTRMGEYAIPWTDNADPEILANGETHLKWAVDEEEVRDVYFSRIRPVYFGSRKAFIVCEVSNV